MKLNYKRTVLIGLGETVTGVIMAADHNESGKTW